jgi:hypothetical protein
VTVEAGVVFTGVARFGWSCGTSRAGDGKIGDQWPDTLLELHEHEYDIK